MSGGDGGVAVAVERMVARAVERVVARAVAMAVVVAGDNGGRTMAAVVVRAVVRVVELQMRWSFEGGGVARAEAV